MVEEIAEAMETSTRTARRLLAAVKDIEPDLKSQLAADSQKKLWYLPSGEVEVSFYCESIREVAHECLRWDAHLVAIGPDPLRAIVQEICQNMQAASQEPL